MFSIKPYTGPYSCIITKNINWAAKYFLSLIPKPIPVVFNRYITLDEDNAAILSMNIAIF